MESPEKEEEEDEKMSEEELKSMGSKQLKYRKGGVQEEAEAAL